MAGESESLPDELRIPLGVSEGHMTTPAAQSPVVTKSESQDSQRSVSAGSEPSESVDGHVSARPTDYWLLS